MTCRFPFFAIAGRLRRSRQQIQSLSRATSVGGSIANGNDAAPSVVYDHLRLEDGHAAGWGGQGRRREADQRSVCLVGVRGAVGRPASPRPRSTDLPDVTPSSLVVSPCSASAENLTGAGHEAASRNTSPGEAASADRRHETPSSLLVLG
jgi:hypothetical protein